MSAFDDIRRALTEAYGTGDALDDLTADDLIKAAVTELELDAQAYPGELAMLRGLVRTLRVIVRDDNTMAEARRLLHQHAADEAAAYAEQGNPAPARQAALLAAILQAPARRWKSGRAVKTLRELGYHPISPGTASHDLAALATAGHLIRCEADGVRWYEIARPGGPRG